MMKRALFSLLICVLCVIPLAAAAQADTQTIDLGDGVEIVVPADWDVDESQENGIVATGDEWSVAIVAPANVERLVNLRAGLDVVGAMTAIVAANASLSVEPTEIVKMQVDGRTIATVADEAEGMLLVAVPIGDAFGLLVFSGEVTLFSAREPEIEGIIASFNLADADTASASSGAACTVSVATANSAALRVGPGTNRSSISFLPANADVTVTGRNELDDGSVWYQLDKTEAAPGGSAAAELWVNAEDVDSSGDCDNVGDTSAPPVIPISVAPPPAATPAPGEPAPDQPAPAGAGALPVNGVWTLTLAAITNASCLGYDNVALNTAEVYTMPSFQDTISVINNNAFMSGTDRFTRIGTSNSFAGTFTFNYTEGGTTVTQVRYDVISPTRMSGQITDNYTYDDGTPCSDTVTFVATLN